MGLFSGDFSMYDWSSKGDISDFAKQNQAFQNQKDQRWLEKQYGFSLPQAQSPEDRFFSSMSKYMPSGSASQGAAPPNEYENKLRALMANPDSIQNSGDYKFRFNQGQQALERSAAARGMTGSGNVLAELAKYGQGMASSAYGAEADRLAGLSSQANQFQLGREQNQIAREGNAIKNMATMYDMYNKTPRFVIA